VGTIDAEYEVKMPTKRSPLAIGSLISMICVVYQSLYRAVPANGDLLLGLPIGKEFAHPGLFSKYDLLVSSGVRGPYHLYKYIGGFLYQINANVDIIWECFFLVFLFLTFLSLWFLSLELTQDTFSSALVLAIISITHPLRGSLHASAVPIQSFVTALAAMPLALAAITLLLRKRYFVSMALSSFVFNIHPYVGVLTASAVGVEILFKSQDSFGKRAMVIVGGGLFALPNIVYILAYVPSNFTVDGFDFYTQFRLYALHAFIDAHWREGYGWFFINLAGAVWFARYINEWKRGVLWILFTCWFVLMALYAFNSYVTKNPTIMLMFLFRATYFIKPIIFIMVVNGIYRWRNELRNGATALSWWKPWEVSAAIIFLFFSAILPMKFAVMADTLAFVAYGFIALRIRRQTDSFKLFLAAILYAGIFLLCILIGDDFFPFAGFQELVENVVVGSIVAIAMALLFVFKKLNHQAKSLTKTSGLDISFRQLIIATLCVLLSHHLIISLKDRQIPFIPDIAGIKERIFMHEAPARTAALMHWARTSTPQRSLFIVPPLNWDDFGAFRLVAERGIYATIAEVNQLAFDASIYHQAHQRLVNLGITFPAPREFDQQGYYELTLQDLQRLAKQEHADYIVLEESLMHGTVSSLPTVYHDERYVVLDLHASQ